MNNLIQLLTKEEKKALIICSFKKNEIIFMEDSVCDSIGIVIEGKIEIVSYSFSGKEIVYNTLKRDDLFGNNLLFSNTPRYKGNVVSKTKSIIAFIKKESLVVLLQNNEAFLKEYLKIQSDFGKALNSKIKLLSFENALDRFNYYLFINNNEIRYKNVTALARDLYLERETLSRLLSKLTKKGIIYRDKCLIKSL